MKSLFAFSTLCCLSVPAFSQWLTQSGDGKGSVLFKGSNLSLDATTSELSFSINNLNQPLSLTKKSDNYKWFLGGNLSAKSAEGLGNLFSGGDLVPEARLNGFIGIRFSNSFNAARNQLQQDISASLSAMNKRQAQEFESRMRPFMDSVISNSALRDSSVIRQVTRRFNSGLTNTTTKTFLDFLKEINDPNAEVSNIRNVLIDKTKAIAKENAEERDQLTKPLITSFDEFKDQSLNALSIFGFGGIDALTFKRVDIISPANISGSFTKEEYRGGNAGIGLNFQHNRLKVGVTFAFFNETNNFSSLDKTDYKLTTTISNTATNQTLVQEKSITGYSGTYGKINVKQINIDVMYNFNLNKTFENFALVNPYFRTTTSTDDSSIIPDNYTFGLGTYFFKKSSKFLGGLYVELPDVKHAIEKIKPADEQNTRTAIKRLNFGIVTKFSLASVIGVQ